MPPGLSIDPNTGHISGVPTVGGHYEFDVAVYDSGIRSHAGGQRRFVKSVIIDIDPIVAPPVPTLSVWGLVALSLLMALGASFRFVARRA